MRDLLFHFNNKWIKRTSVFFAGVFFIYCAHICSSKILLSDGVQQKFVAPPVGIEHFVFGYKEVVADLLWIRALQDYDYCEVQVESGLCIGNSWLYRMIDTITNLSPHFRMPYATGSLALTVLVNDIQGASLIFDKAVKAFPNDWSILYRAAYQALIEEKNTEKAASLMLQAAKNGGPDWLYQASARIYSEEGKMSIAEGILEDIRSSGGDEKLIKVMEEKIESLRQKQAEKQKSH